MKTEFQVFYDNLLSLSLTAKDEDNAWSQLKNAGLYNKSKLYKLIKVDIK